MAHPHRLEFGLSDKGTCIYSLCISHNEHGKVVAAVINWSLYPAEIAFYLRLENVSGDPPSTFLASANTHSLAYRNMRILESIVGPLYKPNKTQGKTDMRTGGPSVAACSSTSHHNIAFLGSSEIRAARNDAPRLSGVVWVALYSWLGCMLYNCP
jgi:hypothetical protein